MILETTRLTLRNAQPEDADPICEIRNSRYVLRYNPMEPATREKIVQQLERDAFSDRVFYLERKEDHRTIGVVDIAEDDLRYRTGALSLSYYLGEQYANQGYMTEALNKALEYAFGELGAPLVSARVLSGNAASLRLLEKLGFSREGTLRQAVRDFSDNLHDDILFSLLKVEYKPKSHGGKGERL